MLDQLLRENAVREKLHTEMSHCVFVFGDLGFPNSEVADELVSSPHFSRDDEGLTMVPIDQEFRQECLPFRQRGSL